MSIKVSEIAKEIDRLCEERGISYYILAKRSGMQESSVCNMFQKGTTPSYRTLNRMCQGLGITVSQFFNQSSFLEKLPPDEKNLMERYLRMDMESRRRVLEYAHKLLKQHERSESL